MVQVLSRPVTYLSNKALYRSIEEICGWARVPLPVPFGEVLGHNMTSNACERNIALSPLLETKVESIVLDPLNTSNTILNQVSSFISPSPFVVNIFYVQLSPYRRDGWRPPLRSKASPLRTAPSYCWRVAAIIEPAVEQWWRG